MKNFETINSPETRLLNREEIVAEEHALITRLEGKRSPKYGRAMEVMTKLAWQSIEQGKAPQGN